MGEPNHQLRGALRREIGQRVAELRQRGQAGKLSQSELASKVGLTRAAISALEAGSQGVSVLSLCLLASALRVAPGDLLPDARELSSMMVVASSGQKPAESVVEEYLTRHG